MKKMRFIAIVGFAAFILTMAAGATVNRLDSATASPQVQTNTIVDVDELMSKMDMQALPEENWPAI